jgi:protocatechuate 3,4-dioxygenase beta subunit
MVLAIGLTRRLVTTVFFSASESASDPLLDCVADPTRRARMFAIREQASNGADGVPVYRFDIVTRGAAETPFFVD